MKGLSEAENRQKAKELKELRKAKGLKASWVAKRIGIGNAYLSTLENGHRRWTDNMIRDFLKVVGA